MSWTAIMPLKPGPDRKSRLSARLSPAERLALTEAMADHVLACLRSARGVGSVWLLASDPPAGAGLRWFRDPGEGLNAGLARFRDAERPPLLLVIHADLPLLTPGDVEHLLGEAESAGAAIAPDRHGVGTNALALARGVPAFPFAFGEASFDRHLSAIQGHARIVRTPGLSIDIDTPDDLEIARAAGFAPVRA